MKVPGKATIREVQRRPASPPRRTVAAGGDAAATRVARAQGFWGKERLSFGYAFQGLGYCWRTQRHLRIHAAVAVVAVGVGLALGISATEWAIILAMISLVAALELINTVIEVLVDMVTTDFHPKAKVAKDVAAGAVLAAALGSLAVGAAIYLPHLLRLAHLSF